MIIDKIYLVGFMAAGKSTIARALAARLGWVAEDVDDRIEARERRSISSIFATEGEPYFRQVERAVIADLLPLRHVVVATGGGTFVDPDNRGAINSDGFSVWIDVPLAEIVERLPVDGRRPLAADRAQLNRLYEARSIAYAQAHLRIDGSEASVTAIVDRIVAVVRG